MDTVDEKILKELMKNPKTRFRKIAQKIGVAPVTVQSRIKIMKKQNVIFGTTTIVDLSKIGFQGKAFLHATASNEYDAETTIECISQIPNVFLISETVGRFDLLIMAVFRNVSEILDIVNKIRLLKTIEKVQVSLTDEAQFPLREGYTKIQLFETENP